MWCSSSLNELQLISSFSWKAYFKSPTCFSQVLWNFKSKCLIWGIFLIRWKVTSVKLLINMTLKVRIISQNNTNVFSLFFFNNLYSKCSQNICLWAFHSSVSWSIISSKHLMNEFVGFVLLEESERKCCIFRSYDNYSNFVFAENKARWYLLMIKQRKHVNAIKERYKDIHQWDTPP